MLLALWRAFRNCFLLFATGAAMLCLYCEAIGIPPNLALALRQELRRNDIPFDFEGVKIGPINGVVLVGPRLLDPQKRDTVLLRAEQAMLDFHRDSLLSGTADLSRIELSGASFTLPLDDGSPLAVQDVHLSARLQDGDLLCDSLSGTVAGLKVNLKGHLAHLDKFKSDGKAFDVASLLPPSVALALRQIRDELARSHASAELNVDFDADIRDAAKGVWKIALESTGFSRFGMRISELRLRAESRNGHLDGAHAECRLKREGPEAWFDSGECRLSWRDGICHVERLEARLPFLHLSLEGDIAGIEKKFAPSASAVPSSPESWSKTLKPIRLNLLKAGLIRTQTPSTLQGRFHVDLTDPQFNQATVDINIPDAELPPYGSLKNSSARLVWEKGRLSAPALTLRYNCPPTGLPLPMPDGKIFNLKLRNLECRGFWDGEVLRLSHAALELPSLRLEGSGRLRELTLQRLLAADDAPSASVAKPGPADDAPTAMAAAVGALLAIDRLALEQAAFCRFDFDVPLDHPDAARFSVDADVPAFTFRGLALRHSRLRFTANPERIVVDNLDLGIDNDERLSGGLAYDIASKSISGELRGGLHLNRILGFLDPKVARGLQRIRFGDTAPQFDLQILPTPIADLSQIRLDGHLVIHDIAYRGLNVDSLTGHLVLEPGKVYLRQGRALSRDISGEIDASFDFKTLDLLVRADLVSDPRVYVNFIEHPEARKNYLDIWQSLTWDPTSLIRQTGVFGYHFSGGTTQDNLFFYGHAEAAGAAINGLRTQSLSTDIHLEYPGQVLLDKFTVRLTQGSAILKLGFRNLSDGCIADFEGQSTLAPRDLLQLCDRSLRDLLPGFDMPASATVIARGSMPLSAPEKIYLQASIAAPALGYGVHQATGVELNLGIDQGRMLVQTRRCGLHQGALDAHFERAIAGGPAILQLKGSHMELGSVVSAYGAKHLKAAGGTVDFDADLKLEMSDHDALSAMSGDGHFKVSDGAFWQIPFLGPWLDKVGSVLPFSSATSIRTVSAKLKFLNQSINIQEFSTDGSIISLAGKGAYRWSDGAYHLEMLTSYLKGAIAPFGLDILSGLFSPVTSVMKASVTGSPGKMEWSFDRVDDFLDLFRRRRAAEATPGDPPPLPDGK